MRRTLFGLAVLVLAAAATAAADAVDNPQYKEWAKWREGATVTTKSEVAVGGMVQVVTTQTQTLKKLTAEKAGLEIVSVTEAGGQTIKAPPVAYEILAKVPTLKIDPKDVKVDPKDVPKVNVKETKGRETLSVNGKQLACEWHQIEFEGTTSKTWYSDDVPGRLVKMESRSPEGTTTVRLTEWKAQKK